MIGKTLEHIETMPPSTWMKVTTVFRVLMIWKKIGYISILSVPYNMLVPWHSVVSARKYFANASSSKEHFRVTFVYGDLFIIVAYGASGMNKMLRFSMAHLSTWPLEAYIHKQS